MTTQHTPPPWNYKSVSSGAPCFNALITANGDEIAHVWDDENKQGIAAINAAFIVEACNNYAALKKSHADLLQVAHLALTVVQLLMYPSEKPTTFVNRIKKAITAAESLGVK